MKKDIFKVVCLIMMASIAGSVLADEKTLNLESIVLESFDGDSNYTWKTMGSKFASTVDGETFPKLSLVAAWPQAVFGANREGKDLKSLGIWGKFDRQGYNWIDIYPTASDSEEDDAGPAEIPIPGRVQYLDLWVWGSNLKCTIEAYVRDYQGVVHVIPMGNLTFEGWKNLRATVPTNIPQVKRVLPHLAGLTFVKFRIWTQPTEQVGNFYVYLDQFKIMTDTFESKHDGDDLADPAHIQELWSNGTASN